MAALLANVLPQTTTLAIFKAWGTYLSNGLTSFGLTKTTDTGQVNWGTIATLPSVGVYVYEIWQLTDTLQATTPYVFKVEYGCTATTNASIAITVGSSTDGAGNVFNAGSRNVMLTSGTYSPWFLSGSTNRVQFGWFNASVALGSIFSLERSHDATGADTGAYATYLIGNGNLASPYSFQQTIYPAFGGGVLTYEVGGCGVGTAGSTTVYRNQAFPGMLFPMAGGVGNPLMGGIVIKPGDGATSPLPIVWPMYGANHTYIYGISPGAWATNRTMATANYLAMRWE